MERERVFYANGFGISFHGQEAVLIFKLRALEDVVAAEQAKRKGEDAPEIQEMEVARVHVPRGLAEFMMTELANTFKKHLEERAKQKAATQGEPDVST